ncbi:hypothetical protein AAFF_G00147970 [Aldrovandia affinis]|uniref:Transcription cofactor vestigial-like protein 4 n=1 Tax=Aldrovandia affinis TaxID=143900 RepID=A0AAD7RPF9_9TELE|nr:hypothetical protein AAFF_G00147970 [Aldrovandia affinis]
MPKIKPETKVLIIKNFKSKSPAEVADIFNVSKRQVERIRKRYQETGDVHDRPSGKHANGDYRKDPRDHSRSPIHRTTAPAMSLHGNHLYSHMPSLAMEQPLALTSMDATRTVAISPIVGPIEHQQNRPSVIICASANNRNCNLSYCPVSHNSCTSSLPSNYRRPSNTNTACDQVIEEHFRRSLGKNYKEPEPVTNSVSITGTVDDHFAKALGETWFQMKAKGNGSSSPDSSPSNHMVNHNYSPSVVS